MRLICVMGGVISGVGKGIVASSIARILKEHGFSVAAVKIDPYINFDAGTMRPTEHGEVWVTDDGGEIDQDLGNYERFLEEYVPKKNNITTGQVYQAVIERERAGGYLGKTVQFIPHIPEEVIRRIREASHDKDVTIVEVGGTVGDYENIPYLFAIRRLQNELGRRSVSIVLVSYFPVPSNVGEPKSKPTQQSIRMLSENGISPDFIVCRSREPIDAVRRQKIETYANIAAENVIAAPDLAHVYEVPLYFERERLGQKLMSQLGLIPTRQPDWSPWKERLERLSSPRRRVRVGIVGKYVGIGDYSLADSYISINESLKHAASAHHAAVDITWVDAAKLEQGDPSKHLHCDGVIVPGGFGASGIDGKLNAISFAREQKVPFLGLCYGMQLAVIEFARNVAGLEGAHSTEIEAKTPHPVIDVLPTQKALLEKKKYGGTMRLGAYAAVIEASSSVHKWYAANGRMDRDRARANALLANGNAFRVGENKGDLVLERHRHRFEVNPAYVSKIAKKGMVFSGAHTRTDGEKLMEFAELPNHPFFISTQAHPEFKSSLTDPAPLFSGFIHACLAQRQ